MIAFILAAPHSGSGKTAVASGLLALFKRHFPRVAAFKCGPDYIDTMFHRAALGLESHNLDSFLSGKEGAAAQFARYSEGADVALVEGVMGYYDGLGGTTEEASTYELARALKLPTILVLRARGASLSLAAEIRGFSGFREPSNIAGVILNECSPLLCKTLAPVLEKETGIPVLGCLPSMEEASFASRHLGLYTAGEISDLEAKLNKIADALEENLDLARLYEICSAASAEGTEVSPAPKEKPCRPKISVARDEAFCFLYGETLDALRDAGAELEYFSPLRDRALPPGTAGLYIPGGYPELYAKELEENRAMRSVVRRAVLSGLPTIAECGGFMYLGGRMEGADGKLYDMCGALLGTATKKDRLVRFGYAYLTAKEDSMLFRRGEKYPVHEFHYWDSTENGRDLTAEKPVSGKSWAAGIAGESLYAGFPHLYLAGKPELAERFVTACGEYMKRRSGAK